MKRLARRMPWWIKLGAKVALSRVPWAPRALHAVGLFRHGKMNDSEYSLSVFRQHHALVRPPAGFRCLELGPGEAACTVLVARSHGAVATYLCDAGDFITRDARVYCGMARHLEEAGFGRSPEFATFDGMMEACNGYHLTRGLASLREIPEGSLDFIFSHSVLQHIRKGEFMDTLRRLRQLLKPEGCMTALVDFRDCIAASLNNLRFREGVWESGWIRRSGCYTNRLRFSQMLSALREAGFEVSAERVESWKCLPVPLKRLAVPFRQMNLEDLLVHTAFLVARPGSSHPPLHPQGEAQPA